MASFSVMGEFWALGLQRMAVRVLWKQLSENLKLPVSRPQSTRVLCRHCLSRRDGTSALFRRLMRPRGSALQYHEPCSRLAIDAASSMGLGDGDPRLPGLCFCYTFSLTSFFWPGAVIISTLGPNMRLLFDSVEALRLQGGHTRDFPLDAFGHGYCNFFWWAQRLHWDTSLGKNHSAPRPFSRKILIHLK
jgi:hypothetical protein